MNLVRLRLPALLYGFCVCVLEPLSVEGAIIEGPSDIIYYSNQGPVKLTCTISEGSTGWRVNGSGRVFTLTNIREGELAGHNVSGVNSLLVINAINSTQYQCVSIKDAGDVDSDPAFLYVAGPPAMVGNVMIDVDTISVDNKNVSFTLNWDEPFANFDPIVIYTITINCSDASCPVMLSTNNVTTTTNVSFTTNLSMMTPLSVTASNSIGTSDPTVIVIGAPGHVDMLNSTCVPVDLINQCYVTWNAPANYAATSIAYTVYYFGENITTASDSINVSMATIDLPAVDSDVNIFVTAVNVFGSGPNSTIFINIILSSSITNATATLDTPNEYRTLHSVTVTCTINPDSAANMCEVMATANGHATLTRNALITNGMATVTIDGLVCGVTYAIIAGGTLDGDLVGPRSSHGTITAGPCPLITVTTTATITSVTVTDVTIRIASSVVPSAIPSRLPPGPTDGDDDNAGVIIGVVVGGIIAIIVIFVPLIIVYYYCKKYKKKRKPGNAPVAMSNIPVHDTVPDSTVSDKVKMESNPAYEVFTPDHTNKGPDPAYEMLASDQANKGPDPAYQDLSSYSGRASASKQKPAGDVNYYEDIINDQNITMTKNPSYAVPKL